MGQERAILVGIDWRKAGDGLEDTLNELAELAATAGAQVVGRLVQKRGRPDPAYLVGFGKAEEIGDYASCQAAELVIFDEELTPAQQRNLEELVGAKVIDRTGLILDIFAQRARTREAQLQVELAQLNYILPRLGGKGLELSRLGGGIGTRGPGETKLEADRRRIRRRVVELRRELEAVRAQRELLRRPRSRAGVRAVALVGYTNAGKSTLFNALTSGGVPAEDRLFATLDPTIRQLALPGKARAVLADTVGFIRKLPHHLVAAFRATLEEVVQADLLLHVMDAGAADLMERAEAVQTVLAELGAGGHPAITVLNKCDLLDGGAVDGLLRSFPGAVAISAKEGRGLAELLATVSAHLTSQRREYRLFLPFSAGGVLSNLHREGLVRQEEYGPEGVDVLVQLDQAAAERLRMYWAQKPPISAGN